MRPALWEPRCDTIADHDTVVYETDDSEDLPDAARFETSVNAPSCVSIGFNRMLCSSPSDLPEGEAPDIVTDMGMDAPPITLYQDIPVVVGEHPSDQDLVNYLDVPDGVLDANREGAPLTCNQVLVAQAAKKNEHGRGGRTTSGPAPSHLNGPVRRSGRHHLSETA